MVKISGFIKKLLHAVDSCTIKPKVKGSKIQQREPEALFCASGYLVELNNTLNKKSRV